MKRLLYILIIVALSACSKDNVEYQNQYDKSYQNYLSFKKENNNSYSYVTQSSSWLGFTSETTINVVNGSIESRSFQYTYIGKTKMPPNGWTKETAIQGLTEAGYSLSAIESNFGTTIIDKLQWTEQKSQLGDNASKENLLTLDQIYQKAKEEWIIKRAKATIYFEANNAGLISQAGYVADGCQDDCFVGINIIRIDKEV